MCEGFTLIDVKSTISKRTKVAQAGSCHSIISSLSFLIESHLGVTPAEPTLSKCPQLGSIIQVMLEKWKWQDLEMAVAECQPAEISSVQT